MSQWKLEIEDELEEMEEEAMEIYKKKIAEYDDALKKHADQIKAKVLLVNHWLLVVTSKHVVLKIFH